MTIATGLKVIRSMSPLQVYRKIVHYGLNRSGAIRLIEPVGQYTPMPGADYRTTDDARFNARIAETERLLRQLPDDCRAALARHGRRISHERLVPYFHAREVWLSSPPNFHWDPDEDVHWPADDHCSTYVSFDPSRGDMKRVWEINRMTYLSSVLPSSHLADPSTAARNELFFKEIVSAWLDANPPRTGVAWTCGQELSIRSISMLLCLHFQSLSLAEVDSRLASYFEMAARHVGKHIGFARSQRNNHAITEACFLILYGTLLPGLRRARELRERGVRILIESIGDQFFADGAYIQNSHTYHRFALQSILLVCSFDAELAGHAAIRACLSRSYDFLEAHRVPGTNTLPNYGPNDGALLYNFAGTDYRNFESVLHAMAAALGVSREVRHPLDLVDAYYLFPSRAPSCVRRDGGLPTPASHAFRTTGYYVLRGSSTSVYFRCGGYGAHAPSQNDALHVDLWCDGEEVLVDSGTYEYFSKGRPEAFVEYLSTRAHNTLAVGGRDQLEKGPNFTFLTRLDVGNVEFSPRRVSGEHDGFRGRVSPDCVHHRDVHLSGERDCVVTDRLTGAGGQPVAVYWHVASADVRRAGEASVAWGDHTLSFSSPEGIAVAIEPATRSLYYGSESAITRVTVSFTSSGDAAEVETRWSRRRRS